MLRVRQRSDQARLLDDRDRDAALYLCAVDPVANVFVESRIRAFGLDPGRLGAQVWGLEQGGRLVSLCYAGANLVPVQASPQAVTAFAERALRQGRRCSSIVGASATVGELWGLLRPYWGPARDVRAAQPLMAIDGPSPVDADPAVRRVRLDEIDTLLPASIAMFTEEVGISPLTGDGGLRRAGQAYRPPMLIDRRPGGSRARHLVAPGAILGSSPRDPAQPAADGDVGRSADRARSAGQNGTPGRTRDTAARQHRDVHRGGRHLAHRQ